MHLEKDVTESSLECALNQIRRLGFAISTWSSESEVQNFKQYSMMFMTNITVFALV